MLRQRIITALILAPIAVGGVFFLPPLFFGVFIGAILTVAAWEWANLAHLGGAMRYGYALVIALLMAATHWIDAAIPLLVAGLLWWSVAMALILQYPDATRLWRDPGVKAAIGILVLVPGFVSLIALKSMADSTFLISLLFVLIWSTDIGAYFVGRAFGKRKLAPKVSPGKSWEGVYGGLMAAIVVVVAMGAWFDPALLFSLDGLVFTSGCVAVAAVSIVGDLAVSMFKRARDIKDSSNLLPGHGGVLDRIDSLLSAGPVFAVFLLWFRAS